MTDTANMTRIRQVATVFVPVADQDRARCALTKEDVEADHASLRAGGVEVDAEIARKGKRRSGIVSTETTVGDRVPPQFFFRDIDGNSFLIVEPD